MATAVTSPSITPNPGERNHGAATWMLRQPLPLPFVWLHQLELRNALRLRVFRGEITPTQRDSSLNLILADLASGVLTIMTPPQASVMTEAERLSATHSESLCTRSLDILHVAAALVLGATEFLTFDQRQIQLARSTGLRVPVL